MMSYSGGDGGWRRAVGNVRSFVGNATGGLRGGTNLASWVVAGTLAYFLWVKPSQDLKREQEEKAALAASAPHRYVEKRKPIPDPQDQLEIRSLGLILELIAPYSILLPLLSQKAADAPTKAARSGTV